MVLKTETINPDTYKALEDIVGPEYISREPVICDTYCFTFGLELVFDHSKFAIRPLAVILPASTYEVQAIVKVCNRYRIKFKAHSTGFGPSGMAGSEPFLSIDLRRMNRIITIDERNMYAVVEPYVSFGILMDTAMKKGLRVYQIGAGPSCSVLANATSMNGFGTVNVSAGFGGHTPLAVEWVLPDGQILRMGTSGTHGEWFCGDGPGPSLKGLMRGIIGAEGALGVFTKAAIKLVPWYGPQKIKSSDKPPNYLVEVPDNMRVYTFIFPSQEKLYEAMRLIQEERIAYSCSRRGPFTMAAGATGSNKEVWELWQKGEFKEKLAKFTNNVVVVLDASSPREMEFKEKCLGKIIDKVEGEMISESAEEITARFVHAFNCLGAVKGTFRSTGSFTSNPSAEEALDSVRLAQEKGLEIKNKYAKAGVILDDGDSTWVTLLEDSLGGHMEMPVRYDPADPVACDGAVKHLVESTDGIVNWKLGIGEFEGGYFSGAAIHDKTGPKCLNYHTWMKKIKKAFDPNLVGESTFYPSEK